MANVVTAPIVDRLIVALEKIAALPEGTAITVAHNEDEDTACIFFGDGEMTYGKHIAEFAARELPLVVSTLLSVAENDAGNPLIHDIINLANGFNAVLKAILAKNGA